MIEKKGPMTNKERMEALLRREKPDRVSILPIVAGFCDLYTGGAVADAYNKPDMFLSAQRKACQDFDWIFYPMMIFPTALAEEFGGDFKYPSGDFAQASMITRHPVNTEEDVWNLKMPDVKIAGTTPIKMEYCKLSSQERLENEPFNVMIWFAPFTGAGQISGVEKFCRWILKKPEVAHRLVRISTDFYIEQAQYWKDTFGTEGVLPFCGEPTTSNQIISPKQFEKFALPYIKEICESMLALGYKHIFVHICGEQNRNLPYWAQIPFGDPGIVSIGHEVELETAAKYFPNDIILGNLDPAILQTGTPEEVYEATRKVVEKGKKLPTGFIFSPGCEVPPRSPVENVMAMTRAVNDFGWYE
ncbi:MAG: uroporphyrinogen decarboxylase family protein [Dissulfuribacterales bacterium]